MKFLKEIIKTIVFRYTRLGKPKYIFNVEPIQLATFINEIERLKESDGCICEIGVARGVTTRFIAQHIKDQKIEKTNQFFAIDTFSSFMKKDLAYEVEERGKKLNELKGFSYNSFEVWKRNFSKFNFVNAIQADCSKFDFSLISPIKVSFLDVDLYLPTKKALSKIYDATIEGGVIIVDDVKDGVTYDGAYQAYTEFCTENNIQPKFIGSKCGIIYKK
jgi:hypothetical protein